jgi:Holliday junction resolvasome RuvABC endonuclease subunit
MIVGIDYSITCPAICLLDSSGEFQKSRFLILSNRKRDELPTLKNIQAELHKTYDTEQARYDHISNSVVHFITSNASQPTIYIEDYAMGAKGKVFNIAENTGLLKHKLHRLSLPVYTVPPTVIKKHATGKGNADKDKMYEAYIGRGNPDLMSVFFDKKTSSGSPVSDIVDAYFIALYGASCSP